MAQHDMNIANQGFPATRADINNALQALASNNSGTSAPSTMFANQWWYDTTNNKLYIRNEANNAWIQVAVLDQTNNEWQITTGVIQAKDGDGLALKTDDGTTRLFVKDDGTIETGNNSNIDILDGSGDVSMRLNTLSSGSNSGRIDVDPANSAASSAFAIHVDGAEKLKIDDTGDIILGGTTTADEANKSFNFQMRSHDTNEENFNVMQLEAEATFNQISIGGGTSALNCATTVRFLTGSVDTTTGGERLRVDNSGFTVDPTNTGGMFGVFNTSSSGDGHILLKRNSTNEYQIGSGTSDEFFIYNYNNSAYALTIDNANRFRVQGVYNGTTSSGANVVVQSDGKMERSTSSLRYKNTVNDAAHGLTELLTLRPVTFKGNDDGDTVFGGLIAEEVHDAGLTEFVQYDDENRPDALSYGNMVSLCIKAIQELSAKNDALEARITALENA